MNEHFKGGLLIIASMFLFAFIGPFVRWLNRPSAVLLFYGGIVGIAILFTYVVIKKGSKALWPNKYKWLLLLAALLAAVNVGSYFQAYRLTTFTNVVLLHYTAPLFAAMFAPIFLKEKIDKITLPALILSSIGLIIIFIKDGFSMNDLSTIGALFALNSGLFYGLSIIANKKLSTIFDPSIIMAYQYSVFFIWLPFMKTADHILSSREITLIVIYMIIISIFPSILYLKGLKRVKAQHAGIIAYIEPIAVILYGYLFFKETPSSLTLIGGAFILLSGYLVLRAEANRR